MECPKGNGENHVGDNLERQEKGLLDKRTDKSRRYSYHYKKEEMGVVRHKN